MDNLESWRMFESTGKIDDYLQYAKEKKIVAYLKKTIQSILNYE